MITQQQAKELLEILIQGGNDYAEIFMETKNIYSVHNFDNKRFSPTKQNTEGTGLRTWKGSEVSYLSIDSIKFTEIKEAAENFSIKGQPKEIKFTLVDGEFSENDFGEWDTKKITERLTEIVDVMKDEDKKVEIASSMVSTNKENRLIANSDGAFIKKTTIYSQILGTAQAKEGNSSEETYHRISKSLTLKDVMNLANDETFTEGLKYSAKLATKLLNADRINSGDMSVILPNGFGGVLFHEAVGHPLEATGIAKNTSKFNGKIDKKVATDLVTLIDDGTMIGERGTAKYDDEGTLNRKRVLIEKGILKEYLIDKFNGEVLMKSNSNGSGRRQNYRFNPTSRMSNTYLQNGTSKVSEIIEATQYGLYAKRIGGGQVDPFTGQFNFSVDEGYVVREGKVCELVKGATLIGNGVDILMKIDMVADDFEISAGSCGSSSGMIPVTCGQPTLRITSMTVGGK